MSFQDEFTALECPNCGGKVELTATQFEELLINTGDGGYVYIGAAGTDQHDAECVHCGTTFKRKQEVKPYQAKGGNVTVGNRGVHVGGNVRGSIVTGDGNSVKIG